MGYLNYEFFDEFKALDNLCRDIYGESFDNRLGVTMYLEDMNRNAYLGEQRVFGWSSDYKRLKSARNMRNDLAHSRNSISVDICSQDDIDFVRSFRTRILNQTDPLAMLRKQTYQESDYRTYQHDQQSEPINLNISPINRPDIGCLGIVASFLAVVACVIAFFI